METRLEARLSKLKTVPGIVPTGYQLSVVIYRGYRSYRAPCIGVYEVFEIGSSHVDDARRLLQKLKV